MLLKLISVISALALLNGAWAQSEGFGDMLRTIASNNKDLTAYAAYIDTRQLQLQSTNNLPDPKVSMYYLPFGPGQTPEYWEFELAQSFEFPSVYGARESVIDQRIQHLQWGYERKRQQILLEASQLIIDVIHLNKHLVIERRRLEFARQVRDQIRELYESDQVGVLELNKSKLVYLQQSYMVDAREQERINYLNELISLNGGNPIAVEMDTFEVGLDLIPLDSIWLDKRTMDPDIQLKIADERVAEKAIDLARKQGLPNFVAGLNYQGFAGANNTGLYAGLSIPLWRNKYKVEASESMLKQRQSESATELQKSYNQLRKKYLDYQAQLKRYRSYAEALEGQASEELLWEAYSLGEISFIEYYAETKFYHDAHDMLFEMQRALYRSRADILKHEL